MNQLFEIKMTTTMGRGIFALEDIPPKKKLLDINKRSYITYSQVAEHTFFGLLSQLEEVNDKKAHFAFYMAFTQKYKKRQKIHFSSMVKYLEKLPSCFHSLILWSQKELSSLEDKKLIEKAKAKCCDLQEKFLKIQQFLVKNKDKIYIPFYQSDDFSSSSSEEQKYSSESHEELKIQDNEGFMNSTTESQEPNQNQSVQSDDSEVGQIEFSEYKNLCENVKFERFLHFYCAIQSRNIYFPTSQDSKSQVGALISILELFNHSPFGKIQMKTYHLQSISEIKKGQQIFINYGDYTNEELLFTYGCVIDNFFEENKNEFLEDWTQKDILNLSKSVISAETISDERVSLANRYNQLYKKEQRPTQK